MDKYEVSIKGFEDPKYIPDLNNKDESSFVNFKRPSGKKCGGFQGMGLSPKVLKGIQKRGYKIPTPIQRKTIPLVLEGRDVVGMARTGSGKTACFLIPMFEKLKSRSCKAGARALILSPTRELAIQTHRFIKELGRFMDLKPSLILGGDAMEQQFDALHGNPDIIVATPGRFLHLCVEMDLKLDAIQYVVFDEADRLFEMGFGEQLREILARLPDSRQTLLFSATLPKMLVEFARAGLSDPVLLRLDVESKIPDTLKLGFITCCSEEKTAVLLSLLHYAVPENSQTAVFVPTKHHVDYIHLLLSKAGFVSTYIYSDLDSSARKINAAKFVTGKAKILVVTDVAARGVDIPCLDTVINYNFPPKPKLFVHRVGRCARAGRCGIAYSMVTGEERPYLLDLHLFLGRPLVLAKNNLSSSSVEPGDWQSGTIGRVPRELLEEEDIEIIHWHELSAELASMKKVCFNAYSQYLRSRPGASNDSVKRAKEIALEEVGEHPEFFSSQTIDGSSKNTSTSLQFAESSNREAFLKQVRSYHPLGTVFELGRNANSSVFSIMREKREKHDSLVEMHRQKVKEREVGNQSNDTVEEEVDHEQRSVELVDSNAEEIGKTFKQIIMPKRKFRDSSPKRKKRKCMDKNHFIPYKPTDFHTEQGLAINNFEREAARFELDLGADTENGYKIRQKLATWDQKKKKMVYMQDDKTKKIRTESGVWIPATYRTGKYEQWKEKCKVNSENIGEEDDEGEEVVGRRGDRGSGRGKGTMGRKLGKRGMEENNNRVGGKFYKGRGKPRSELMRPEEILKQRKIKARQEYREKKKSSSRGRGGGRGGRRGGGQRR